MLKVCDFGLARNFEQPHKTYTNNVVTLWYRCPELLAGQKTYGEEIDIWSVGCIMGELILKETLFPGQSELEMLDRIFKFVGNPKEERWSDWKSLPLSSKIQLNKKNNKASLRDKFPKKPLSEGDPLFLSNKGVDLLSQLLALDPKKRISAKAALEHEWF